MPLIVDTDRRATFSLKTGARLRYESSMNKVWWEQILHESLEDGSWWMKNMLRARKHSNISPFMILRRIFGVWIRNWRDVHVNIAWRNRIDQFKIEKKKGVLERVKFKIDKCPHWWNVVRESKISSTFYMKCCVQKYSNRDNFPSLRPETMSTDMVCCHASFSIINETDN